MNALKGHNTLRLKRMEVRVLKERMAKVRKLAKGNVNLMMTAKMRENFACVTTPVACPVSDLKESVPNYLIRLVVKSISPEGKLINDVKLNDINFYEKNTRYLNLVIACYFSQF